MVRSDYVSPSLNCTFPLYFPLPMVEVTWCLVAFCPLFRHDLYDRVAASDDASWPLLSPIRCFCPFPRSWFQTSTARLDSKKGRESIVTDFPLALFSTRTPFFYGPGNDLALRDTSLPSPRGISPWPYFSSLLFYPPPSPFPASSSRTYQFHESRHGCLYWAPLVFIKTRETKHFFLPYDFFNVDGPVTPAFQEAPKYFDEGSLHVFPVARDEEKAP